MALPSIYEMAVILANATKGRRVRFHPSCCPEAVGTPISEWDTSHNTSVILNDGTRYAKYSEHRHADDAKLDNLAYALAVQYIADSSLIEELLAKIKSLHEEAAGEDI